MWIGVGFSFLYILIVDKQEKSKMGAEKMTVQGIDVQYKRINETDIFRTLGTIV